MDVHHYVEHRKLTFDTNLLRVSVQLKNIGMVKIVIPCEALRVQQVRPLPQSFEKNLQSLQKPMTISSFAREPLQPVRHLNWEQIKMLPYDYGSTEMPLIEPGETDSFEYELLIPSYVETVKIYSFYLNEKESPDGARCIADYTKQSDVIGKGWTATTFYDIREETQKSPR